MFSRRLPLHAILSQLIPFHSHIPCLCKIHFNSYCPPFCTLLTFLKSSRVCHSSLFVTEKEYVEGQHWLTWLTSIFHSSSKALKQATGSNYSQGRSNCIVQHIWKSQWLNHEFKKQRKITGNLFTLLLGGVMMWLHVHDFLCTLENVRRSFMHGITCM